MKTLHSSYTIDSCLYRPPRNYQFTTWQHNKYTMMDEWENDHFSNLPKLKFCRHCTCWRLPCGRGWFSSVEVFRTTGRSGHSDLQSCAPAECIPSWTKRFHKVKTISNFSLQLFNLQINSFKLYIFIVIIVQSDGEIHG